MANGIPEKSWVESGDGQKPTKRISTPAGNRLSAIMNDGTGKSRWSRNDASADRGAAPIIPPIEDLGGEDSVDGADQETEGPRTSTNPYAYATSLHSEKSIFNPHEAERKEPKRSWFASWSRKKLWIVLGIVAVIIVALIIGLAVGLSQSSKSSSKHTVSTHTGSASSTTSSALSTTTGVTSLAPQVTLSKDFPVGQYSLYTFLDTIYTNCTSNPAAWVCSPGVIYNNDHAKSGATFHFNITGNKDAYQIAPFGSDDLMKALKFNSTTLELENAGTNNERYHFQINYDKSGTTNINGANAICDFPQTTFSGYLYTKLAKTYPAQDQSMPATSDSTWPFQMTFEDNNGGGEGVSSCVDAKSGQKLDGVTGENFGDTCSCFYRNWLPSIPT